MKLIGSKTEQELREQLIKSNEILFNGIEYKRLLKALTISFPQMRTAYIIHWIPEQGEDIYKILINDSIVAEIEMDRNKTEFAPIIKTIRLPQYLKGLSKQNQIKLAVALDLARKDLEYLS